MNRTDKAGGVFPKAVFDKGFFRRWTAENVDQIAPFIAVVMGFIVGALLMLVSGHNPLTGYVSLFYGAVKGVEQGDFARIGNILLQMTPLIISGIAAAVSFRSGVINIGIGGQMYFGGFCAVLVGSTLNLPGFLHVPLVIICGMLGGALWASIPGALKAYNETNEIVTTILSNYVALELVNLLAKTYIPGTYETQSRYINESASLRSDGLTAIFDGSYVNYGFVIAICLLVLYWFVLEKTTLGYEMKLVGSSFNVAKYAGVNNKRTMMLSMSVSGAMAGIAGVVYYLGYTNFMQLGQLPSYGFEGIAIALLGLNGALGILLASVLFGILFVGSGYMTIVADIPNELVSTIIATIIYFSATTMLFKEIINDKFVKRGVR